MLYVENANTTTWTSELTACEPCLFYLLLCVKHIFVAKERIFQVNIL
jgi:hypothetical protein